MKINDRVKVSSENDNEGYNSFRDKVLIITHAASNKDEHPGHDDGMAPEKLYDLKEEKSGKDVNCSLYDYELTEV